LGFVAVGGEQGGTGEEDHEHIDGALQGRQDGVIRRVGDDRIQRSGAHGDPGRDDSRHQNGVPTGGDFAGTAEPLAERHQQRRLADGKHRQKIDQFARWLDEKVKKLWS